VLPAVFLNEDAISQGIVLPAGWELTEIGWTRSERGFPALPLVGSSQLGTTFGSAIGAPPGPLCSPSALPCILGRWAFLYGWACSTEMFATYCYLAPAMTIWP